ncbi:hypothetical protein HZC27_03415 [Candidatus Roizmanbacteria bacterium]|nr:hypothetical protein [Candidatus Roizmanbacteria bacterium]
MAGLQSEYITSQLKEKRKYPAPYLLSQEQILKTFPLDFKDRPNLDTKKLESFVKEHVRVVRVADTDVTIIDQEHDEYKGEINPILQAYLESKRTKTAVVEYFLPELSRNAPHLPKVVKKIMGDPIEELPTKDTRANLFMDIAEVMKKCGKTVTCVDIANKLSYELYHLLMKGQSLTMILSLIPQIPFSIADRLFLSTIAPLASLGGDEILEKSDKGIYDKQKISWDENLYISMEDGRRIYAAKALKKLGEDYTKEYPMKDESSRPQIIIVYPRAHALRIADYMTSKSLFTQAAQSAKQFLYYLPNLDHAYRTYTWKESHPPSWDLTTSKKVSPLGLI